MKKLFVKLIILSIIILGVSTSCKTAGGEDSYQPPPPLPQGTFKISIAYGYGWYLPLDNLSALKFAFSVSTVNGIGGVVTDFRIVIRSGDVDLVEINYGNYLSYLLNLEADAEISQQGSASIELDHEENVFINGYLFGAYIPNNMDVYFTVRDNNSYTSIVSGNFSFVYSEIK